MTFQPALKLTDNKARVKANALGEAYNAFLREVWCDPCDKVVHLLDRCAEIGSGLISSDFVVRQTSLRFAEVCIQDDPDFPVFLEHMLYLMTENEPKVVNAIESK